MADLANTLLELYIFTLLPPWAKRAVGGAAIAGLGAVILPPAIAYLRPKPTKNMNLPPGGTGLPDPKATKQFTGTMVALIGGVPMSIIGGAIVGGLDYGFPWSPMLVPVVINGVELLTFG